MSHEPDAGTPKRVFIVDDHELMRVALAQLVAQEPDLLVCGQAADAGTALNAIAGAEPDLAVVDITLQDGHGIDLIKDIRARWPNLPVLVLSMHDESFYAERALHAGATGYVTKAEVSATVIEGIRKVLAGEVYLSEAMASKMLSKLVGRGGEAKAFSVEALSDREFQVFELIGLGLPSREIARRLHLSRKTVDAHREHIKKKLGLDTATDLMMYAIQWIQFERGG